MAKTYKRNFVRGRMSDGRTAWANVQIGEFVVYVKENDDPDDEDSESTMKQEGDNICLMVKGRRGPPTRLWLTNLTEEELNCMYQILKLALEKARPICKARDEQAAKAMEAGDDSFVRIFRSSPTLVIRNES